jgi:aerobic carbon-monoxide dehydrogenase medium subunit
MDSAGSSYGMAFWQSAPWYRTPKSLTHPWCNGIYLPWPAWLGWSENLTSVTGIGGSIANNDPNADYPAACLGLEATIVTNRREIVADEFFTGMFETALESDEIITEVRFPLADKAAYLKFRNPASRFALVGVFVSRRGNHVRVAVTGAAANGVFRMESFEQAFQTRFAPESIERLSVPVSAMTNDIHGSAEYRAQLVKVLARRAVASIS